MAMSDKIEAFITELLKDDDSDWLELGRNELAGIFNCVPSQINYVISTRFGPDKGYMVESRRGGGGYIRIKRIYENPDAKEISEKIGDELSFGDVQNITKHLLDTDKISEREKRIIDSALSDKVIKEDKTRAEILKNILVNGI